MKCKFSSLFIVGIAFAVSIELQSAEQVLQPSPSSSKDIWTTSFYSYAPGGNTPGGGQNNDVLRVGGWGDKYYSLLQFDITGLPSNAKTAKLRLFAKTGTTAPTAIYIDRITSFWDWRTMGTGRDRERLWWADRPTFVQWIPTSLPAPVRGSWYEIDITTLYNSWSNGTHPNYGVQLRPVSSSSNNFEEFYSSDYSVNPTLRPQLLVTTNERDPKLFAICIGQNESTTLRGDKGAQAVFDRLQRQLSWAPASEGNTDAPIVFQNTYQTGVAETVLTKLDGMNIMPGDTLIFYANCHAGPNLNPDGSNGNESSVVIDGMPNTQDEFTAFSLSDDNLVAIFSQPKWHGVQKVFMIDACHSGGFEGTSSQDVGDLEKLENYALLASAPEGQNACAVPDNIPGEVQGSGMGIWTYKLLLPALDVGPLSIDQIKQHISANKDIQVQPYLGLFCPLLDLNSPGAAITFSGLTPVFSQSPGFDSTTPLIPLPKPTLSFLHQGSVAAALWVAKSGLTYQLQVSLDLKTWSPVGAPVVGTGSTIQIEITPSSQQQFFRLAYSQTP